MTTTSRSNTAIRTDRSTRQTLAREVQVSPCLLVILGITGDLAKTKLVPALFELSCRGKLPRRFTVVGCSTSTPGDDELRQMLRESMAQHSRTKPFDEAAWQQFAAGIYSVTGRFDETAFYRDLRDRVVRLDDELGTEGNGIFYLATLASLFPDIVGHLRESGLIRSQTDARQDTGNSPWSRVVIEKPFGRDLDSARELNRLIGDHLHESQIYRIDHFLGKETVQNIAVFRYGNAIFEPLWNRKHVSHVEITAAEPGGIGRRGRFYDETGVVRDIVQNHLLQILSLIAMEPPVSFGADDLRDQKVQLLRSLRPVATPQDVQESMVFGQYEGYRDEKGVASDSRTPTYVAMKAWIDNWRWHGVPFYLRTGKRLAEKRTEVAIWFQSVPHCPFKEQETCRLLEPNVLKLRLQPDEGIDLRFMSKVPGEDLQVSAVHMDMRYDEAFGEPLSDAYERLLLDCMRGDQSLFARSDDVEEAWRFVTPALEAWEARDDPPIPYAAGSAGPREANRLMTGDGWHWTGLGASSH